MLQLINIASPEDAPRIDALMGEQRNNPLFVADDLGFIERHISEEGFTLLIESPDPEEAELSAFLILRFPGEAQDNLGRDLDFSAGELNKCVHMESLVVSLVAQGQGMGGMLISAGLKEAAKRGAEFAFATVHPDNTASLKSFYKNGFEVKADVIKYGGKPRKLLFRKL
ncbi:MAG: GNAT family N-acetyltransferase [Lachnospiraceae bacterium]|nr:GNAT family N-acetyltransferase [Lachnospiraceae bacterium]